MADRIVVITASLPERDAYRQEAIASVHAQELQPVAHLVSIDHERAGPANILNRLLPAAVAYEAEWIAQLADDDILYPQHLRVLAEAGQDADIVYPFCDVEGRGAWNPNREFDADALRRENYIPATTLIRTRLAVQIGGWSDTKFEDYDFWLRALDAGAQFVCVPEATWLYRFHGKNDSYKPH